MNKYSAVERTNECKPGKANFPDLVDPQSWKFPEDMTWDDYKPVPGIDWSNTDIKPDEVLKGALILVDFPDRDFIMSQSEGTEMAGNPQQGFDNMSRENIPEFWKNYLNTPQPSNHYQTVNGFWMENSYGKWGVTFDAFGPYRMDSNEFQYGLNEFGQQENMPSGYEGKDLFSEAVEKAEDDLEASEKDYDFKFIIHAGYAESGVWQEFGEMMFQNREDVTDNFGPPFDDMPNWATTRYVPWTSWYAAKSVWSSAKGDTSVQGENSGVSTFAHEFGHIKDLLDNYNNPYNDPVSRSYSGPWELMSRGAFGGPGGPHTRWKIPATQGGSSPSHHMLRNKIKQGFLDNNEYLDLDRDELKETGPVFADVTAREVPIGDDFNRSGLHGINISMVDLTPENSLKDDWRADMQNGEKWYDNYTLEVVDRIGTDSFQPDSGVLMAKTKNTEDAPNIWVIDSHPEDINAEDFERPDGSIAMMSKGDYRQLSNALFHAGTGSDVVSEYADSYNRLHFYILDKYRDKDGTLHYQTAVRHMDGSESYERCVNVEASTIEPAVSGRVATYHFNVTNNSEKADLVRVMADAKADGETHLNYHVLKVEPGETVDVPVYVTIPEAQSEPDKLIFTAMSETDENQCATKTNILPSHISANGLKSVVTIFDDYGDIENDVSYALNLYLNAAARYEKTGQDGKVVKHLKTFKQLIDDQKDVMTNRAYETLMANAEMLIKIYH